MDNLDARIGRDHGTLAALDRAGAATPEPHSAAGHLASLRAGHGAVASPLRFFAAAAPFDDGWDTLCRDALGLPRAQPTPVPTPSRAATSRNGFPDPGSGSGRAVDPCHGCGQGCIHCDARPTHVRPGHMPGPGFEPPFGFGTRLIFKPGAAECLEREMHRPGYTPSVMALGAGTDPYQPIERTLKLTRQVLEVLDRFSHPAVIVTGSAAVLRDLDILSAMAARNLVRVHVSLTTLDAGLARLMEPRASTPARRLAAVAALAAAGVPAGVLAAPMIPGLNDAELERILQASARAGARHAGCILLRLPPELQETFEAWLHARFPDRARHVLSLIRHTRAGVLNDPPSPSPHRLAGQQPYDGLLRQRFRRAARQCGFPEALPRLDNGSFRVPGAPVTTPPPRARVPHGPHRPDPPPTPARMPGKGAAA